MNLKYNSAFHDRWAWSLAIKGEKDKDIANAMGISEKTLNMWKFERDPDTKQPIRDENGEKKLTSFGKALSAGKEAADADVEYGLYQNAIGYEYQEVKEIYKYDSNGRAKLQRREVTTKHVPPNTMAEMYWLNNRQRGTGEWAQKQEVALSADDSLAGVTIYLPDNGRDRDEISVIEDGNAESE